MPGDTFTFHWWSVRPEVLWTDWLVYLLVGAITAFVIYARRHEHLRAPWRSVLRRRLAMSALVVMLTYIGIGLLDSVHFRVPVAKPEGGGVRYSAEVYSLLDRLVLPLKTQTETTYSSPFAAHLYTKESIELPDGSVTRDYPRLVHGAAHLDDPDRQLWPDVRQRSLNAVLHSVIVVAVLVFALAWWQARRARTCLTAMLRQMWNGETGYPWKSLLATAGLLVLVFMLALQLAPHYHVLGTDKVGTDVFYQSLKSIRTGLLIGTLTTLVMLPFAILFGIMAGYFRGWIDDVIQYLYTTLSSIPGILLIAAAVLIMQAYIDSHPDLFRSVTQRADIRLLFLCMILGITSWTSLCRLLRGEVLKLREVDYIQAAQAFGVSSARIISRHLLPNTMHIVLIVIVLDFSGLVLAEAVLSYVGVGVDPSMISWGNMINSARLEMAREPIVWWSLMAAFVFMFLLVLAANLLADAVRDAFDPRLRTQ
ncbi:MAG: ABC transporter permease [Granulosicoccaceae bacterium]|jgi:peptide/nickel transport system permease protein